MVSAIPLCLLAIGIALASSQDLSAEVESPDVPISDRRTFKHGKPVKVFPLVKKHKKFGGGVVPHVFGKTSYAEVPVFHEAPKPIYKVHRYPAVEVKPLPDFSVSTPDPFIETHSLEPPADFPHAFDHSVPAPFHSPNLLLFPVNDKPVFASPSFSSPHPAPVFTNLPPPPPPKPILSYVPPPQQPVFPALPITAVPSIITIPRPAAQLPVIPQAPAFPVFTSIPIKIQPPVLPPLPPQLPSPSPPPVYSSVQIKVPAPALPPIPASPSPTVFPTVSITPPPLTHAFPSLPPPSLQVVPAPSPSPIPSFQTLPASAPVLPAISASPEPEFPYPPSGVPIPSYIKDISLPEIEIKETPPTVEPPKFQEPTPAAIETAPQDVKHLSAVTADDGLLQKLKGWKADKANAALSHFSSFKQKPFPHFSLPTLPFHHAPNKIPLEAPPSPAPAPTPIHPTLQFPAPVHPLPLAPQAPAFFHPSPPFFPPPKYESFPPNHVEPPTVFNSYGAPVPHDYAPPHDRLSSAASEEEPALVPAPKEQNAAQKPELQQRPTAQILQDFQSQNFQFQTPSTPHVQPVYVPEDTKTVKEGTTATEDAQPEADDYSAPKDENPETPVSDGHAYRNHKE